MNFLAHLHIAEHSQSSLLGNLLGDFVKGDPQGKFDDQIVQGVRLHRFVDAYTDSHQLILQSKQLFPNGHRRFAGIALDMFWDHCLARDWQNYHDLTLKDFCDYAEQTVNGTQASLPEAFVRTNSLMWKGRWLESYRELDNIEYALQRMSLRSSRMGKLAECYPYLEQNYASLNQVFSTLYPQILNASKRF